MIIKIAGATVDYQVNSIQFDDAIGERSTASFSIIDRAGIFNYQKGQVVQMFENDGTTLVFAGGIDRPTSQYLSLASNAKIHQIECVDYHFIADKKVIAKLYTNTLAGDIVKDIITNYLASDGITAGTIQDGQIVQEAVFNYIPTSRALERLAEIAGFEFYIDYNKALHFFHRATNYNNTVITETSRISNLQREPVSEDYRNKQYIRAGMDTTDVQTEIFKGDSTQKTFAVGYKLAKEPVVKVDGVTQTVGIRGLENGLQWYWNKGETVISQDDSGTPLTASQTLRIDYQGLFDIVVVSYDQTEIERMKTLEGGTGIHEHVIDDPYLTSREAAFESAGSKLARYAKVGNKITFDTLITGLKAGQLIRITLTSYGIDDYFLIESVRGSELGTDDGRMVYSVSVVDGSATGGWANFFKKLAEKGDMFVLRENIQENEVLTTLNPFSKTWLSGTASNIFKVIYPGAALTPGTNTIAGFADADRVKYIAFYNAADVELFRKSITKQTASSTQITSISYIAPYEVNAVQITKVGWIGGSLATNNTGSGVIVDKQAFNKLKSDMEALQFDKTDTKGF